MRNEPAAAPALEKRAQPGGVRSVFLAVMVHAAFFALIVFGVTWQSRPTAPVQAELWDKIAPKAAPEPREEPKPEPPKAEPKPPEKPPEEVKPAEPPKPDPAIAEKLEREKRLKEKREKEKLEKQKQEEAKKKKEEEQAAKKKREEEIARREAEKAREEAAAARQKEVDRYVEQIKAKIRGRANVPDTVQGNPEVTVRIHILPGGEVLDIAIIRRSPNPAYDNAIERAIRSASPLPVPPPSSELFPRFRELNLQFRHER